MKKDESEIKLAPIVFFAYNRPEHTKRSIESLKKNRLAEHSELFVFSDGSKADYDSKEVSEVRKILDGINGFESVTIIKREYNYGLAKNIIDGVTEIVNSHGRAIVVECDLILSPGFLEYMNKALNFYEKNEDVMQISGYVYPIKTKLPETFFLRFGSCWGWATWDRAWKYFINDANFLINKIKSEEDIFEFNLDGSYNAYEQLLLNCQEKLKTWTIKWHSVIFLKRGLTLFPYPSLVNNIGSDFSGVHRENTNKYSWENLSESVDIKSIKIEESVFARKKIIEYFNRSKYPAGGYGSVLYRIKRVDFIKKLLQSIEHKRYSQAGFFRLFVAAKDFLFVHFFGGIGNIADSKEINSVPWWNQEAIKWLGLNLKSNYKVFEWGSGGSTIYLSKRTKEVVSVEHNFHWHKKLLKELKKNNISNCSCVLIEPTKIPGNELINFPKELTSSNIESRGYSFEGYINFIEKYPNNYFDMVIIDGRSRLSCIKKSISKVKKGGFIILDDSEREEYSNVDKILNDYKRINLHDCKSKSSVTSVWKID